MKKSLPQSNATHLTAPSRRGRKRRAIRESPLQRVVEDADPYARNGMRLLYKPPIYSISAKMVLDSKKPFRVRAMRSSSAVI